MNYFSRLWLCLFLVKSLKSVNAFWQRDYWNRFFLLCLPLWIVKWSDVLNNFRQTEHLNVLSPLWNCLVKLLDCANVFWQREHWNGFSPLWICLCVVKWSDILNDFEHRGHWNDFYLLWLRLLKVNLPDVVNAFWQKGHQNGYFQYGFLCGYLSYWIQQIFFDRRNIIIFLSTVAMFIFN